MTEVSPIKISIIILTFNRKDVVQELLVSLTNIKSNLLEIIVVDNCSCDGTAEMIRNTFPDVYLIKMPRNIGVEGRNVGIVNASGEILITLDDDILGIDESSIRLIEKKFQEDKSLAAICFQVRDYYNNEICNWCHPYPQEKFFSVELETTEISEGAVSFRSIIFDEVGLYPENFFISHEGADLCARIIDRGYKIIYFPDVSVQHKYATQGRKNWRRYYFDTRNAYFLAIRNYRILHAISYVLRRSITMMIYSVRDGFFRYWLKAQMDGLWGLISMQSTRKPISAKAETRMKSINKNRPTAIYYFKKRFLKKQVRI